MKSPNEFWLYLHRLSAAYDAEGPSSGERDANIVEQFSAMPSIAQRQVLGDLIHLTNHLPTLHRLVSSVQQLQSPQAHDADVA